MDRSAILAHLDAIDAMVRSVRVALDAEPADELLDAKQSFERFSIGRDGLLGAERRGEITLTRGRRNKIMVKRSALEALQRRPHQPTRARRSAPATDLESYDREAERELRLLAGGAR
ncbi:MAG TPA: hypothetical protein VFR23_26135 [Jiangellaceae bacterium]|nr:hypothetical protein [Jiangellaceae bacterium]